MKSILKTLAVALMGLTQSPVWAEDVDLFAWANKSATGSANVLFILDNAANFSASVSDMRCNISSSGVVKTDGTGSAADFTALDRSAGAVEQCALYTVIKSMATSTSVTLNLGVMGFNANGMMSLNPTTGGYSADCVGGTGGCLLMPITAFNGTVKDNMLAWIKGWTTSGNSNNNIKGNNTANGAAMQEAWAYYQGRTGVSGRSYSAVAPSGGCGNNYVIFIGNAYRNNATPGDGTNEANSPYKPLAGTSSTANKNANPAATTAEKAVITGTLSTSCGSATLQTDEGKGVYALNWAKYMKNNHNIKTYAIGVLGPTCNAEYAAHLTKLGSKEVGGGNYYGTNSYADLVIALNTALTEIMSVNSVFSAVSLPASVNTQGEYLNQIFVGMFRPHDDFSPRWNGNVKQYKLGYFNGVLQTLDADNARAINSNTGFISECARSFWTPTTTDSYWENDPKGSCTVVADSKQSNYPDGNVVEKGGQAYQLRSIAPADRVVKTCSPVLATCNSGGLSAFSDSSATNAQLGVAVDADRTKLVSWAKGKNEADNTGSYELGKAATVIRPSVHGDVVHSRPAAVNHGTNDSNDIKVVVYYGANDGMLRAINGNQTAAFSSNGNTYQPGQELWSFMPPEFYGNIKRLYDNAPAIDFPESNVDGATPKAYGMDGPITAFRTVVSGVTKTYVYATMRRGGRAVYAFDVTVPGNPALAWKAGCGSASLASTDCSTSMGDIGQTWSQVKPVYASNYDSGNTALLVMGGGYDTCEDYDALSPTGANHNCTATSKGKKVYVLNALTGAVVRAFDTVAPSGGVARGVVAEVAIVNEGGKAKYGYAVDLGGNVYRISFAGANSNDWSMTRIASLGCSTPASCTANRKFMFMPSVVTTDNETYNILVGSGDREKPVTYYQGSKSVSNYMFMVKDKPSDATWLSSQSATCSSTNVICMNSLFAITSTIPTDDELALKKGWAWPLASTEQVTTPAVTFAGQTFFSTHAPATAADAADSCSTNLGAAKAYCMSYHNARGCFADGAESEITSGGLAPAPVIVTVTVPTYDYGTGTGSLDTTESVPVCIGCATGEDGQAGGSGDVYGGGGSDSGLGAGSEDASNQDSGLGAGKLNIGSNAIRYKNRLYWYLQK